MLIYVWHALHDHLQNQLQHLIVLFTIDYTTCCMRLYKFNHSKFLINKVLEGQFLKNKGTVQTAEEWNIHGSSRFILLVKYPAKLKVRFLESFVILSLRIHTETKKATLLFTSLPCGFFSRKDFYRDDCESFTFKFLKIIKSNINIETTML